MFSGAAGCSPQAVSSALPNAQVSLPKASAATSFKTIYSFEGSPDGSEPFAGVTVSPANSRYLFGTTVGGGSGAGTVWSVNLSSDTETVVYKFPGKPDGSRPFADLAVLDHFLYGTTLFGGTYGNPYAMADFTALLKEVARTNRELFLKSCLNAGVDACLTCYGTRTCVRGAQPPMADGR